MNEQLIKELFDVCEREKIFYSNHILKIFNQLVEKGMISYDAINMIWGEGE